MKKAIVSVLCVVLVLSLSVVAFVACDKNDKTASNSDVLGTAVAVAASQLGGASTAAEDANDDFKAGINLNIGNDAASLAAGATINGIGKAVTPIIESAVGKVDKFLGDNGISVNKVESDDKDYSEKFSITYTYVNDKTGESITEELALYVKLSEGAELEGKKDYTFDAKVVKVVKQEGKEDISITLASFSGQAKFDTDKDAMVFSFGADGTSASAFANLKAYSTKKGSIVLEMNAGAGISGTATANASVSIELGKVDNKYGAIVTVSGNTEAFGYGASFTVIAKVSANSAEDASDFAISGSFDATIKLGAALGEYNAKADLNGKAHYDVESDSLKLGLNGNVTFAKVENK